MKNAERAKRVREATEMVEMVDYLCTVFISSFPKGYGLELSRLRIHLAEGWDI